MKKILFSLSLVATALALAAGGTYALFSDVETSTGNILTAGTIDIAVNSENAWQETFDWDNMLPGEDREIVLHVTNVGQNPVKLWQAHKCTATEENGVIEPEQAWYDEENGGNPKNDIDTAIVYEMHVGDYPLVARAAGITLDKIENGYINLVASDQPFTAGEGTLAPGASVDIIQRYYLKEDTDNWAQSDRLAFTLEILAQQTDAPEPLRQLSFMDNKYNNNTWTPTADGIASLLRYEAQAPTFNYDYYAVGLNPATDYCLFYYADGWPGNHPGAFIANGVPDAAGTLELSGQAAIAYDMPSLPDANYPYGAKIWLAPCSKYSQSTRSLTSWSPNNSDWLFDTWPGLIRYTVGDRPAENDDCAAQTDGGDDEEEEGNDGSETLTVAINGDGGDRDRQYGYNFDYSGADVQFAYASPSADRLSGTITATGLKPYATYQLKLTGTPTCLDPVNGNDSQNEYIGSIGRWWDATANANATDAQKAANPGHCYIGYLVFDHITADAAGNAVKSVATANSYHVLWCSQAACGATGNTGLAALDPAYPGVLFCTGADVSGEIERFSCGGLTLASGDYDLTLVLTEESFHQGDWASVLSGKIGFAID